MLVILGPTGSGKSHLALRLAEAFHGEIVSCDSVQVYRGFSIGAAKATPEERQRVPHHLLDLAGPGEEFTAGDYARAARAALADISSRGKLPIVAGGTGLYLKALLHGLAPAPRRNESLRERLRRIALRRPAALHRLLTSFDRAAAARIHSNDHQKLIRALEIAITERTTVTAVHSRSRDPLDGYSILKIGLNPERVLLHAAVNRRSAEMFAAGLIEETELLIASGYGIASKPVQSLGYRQAVHVLRGELSLSEAVQQCQTKTRQYVKRQMTWFRGEQDVCWLDGFGTDARVFERAVAALRASLLSSSETQMSVREQR